MTSIKSVMKASVALCIAAILVIAACGCEDLGAYENADQYCKSFGSIALIAGSSDKVDTYSVGESFYNEDSRENFLAESEDRVAYGDYMYMAIPFVNTINMDTLSLFLQSQSNVTVYINMFVISEAEWEAIIDHETNPDDSETTENKYNGPAIDSRIGNVTVELEKEKWSSFVLDSFVVNNNTQKSIQINSGEYILLHIVNNDKTNGLEIPDAVITMTNLLVRALEITGGDEAQGGEENV